MSEPEEKHFDAPSASLIVRQFDLEDAQGRAFSEQDLLDALARRIDYMIEHDMDMLLSLLYRLDVDEQKINRALDPAAPDPAHIGLARLVLERQKQRVATRQQYRPPGAGDWNWDF